MLQDNILLAELTVGDIDANYHLNCIVSFYNMSNHMKCGGNNQENSIHGIIFPERVSYIREFREDE